MALENGCEIYEQYQLFFFSFNEFSTLKFSIFLQKIFYFLHTTLEKFEKKKFEIENKFIFHVVVGPFSTIFKSGTYFLSHVSRKWRGAVVASQQDVGNFSDFSIFRNFNRFFQF